MNGRRTPGSPDASLAGKETAREDDGISVAVSDRMDTLAKVRIA